MVGDRSKAGEERLLLCFGEKLAISLSADARMWLPPAAEEAEGVGDFRMVRSETGLSLGVEDRELDARTRVTTGGGDGAMAGGGESGERAGGGVSYCSETFGNFLRANFPLAFTSPGIFSRGRGFVSLRSIIGAELLFASFERFDLGEVVFVLSRELRKEIFEITDARGLASKDTRFEEFDFPGSAHFCSEISRGALEAARSDFNDEPEEY